MITTADLQVGEPFSGVRRLSAVVGQQLVIRTYRERSLAESADDCLYAVTDGKVMKIPVDRRTPKQIKFRYPSHNSATPVEHTVDREGIEQHGCVQYGYLPETITGHCLYATPGLAEALLGQPLPPVPKYDWREPEDKARDDRKLMRSIYRMYHEQVDQMTGWGFILTDSEAAGIHDRIDAAVKRDGYWDDDLPAEWWRAQ